MLAGEGVTAILVAAGGIPVWLIATFVALFGLTLGSFLNVCIARLPHHASIVRPGSRCPRCGMAIRVRDNVPILSWLLLRGKCRDCGWRIPWRYPAVEAAAAALFLLCFFQFGLTVVGGGMAVLCFLLLGLAVMDAETMRLPDAFTLPGIGLGIVYTEVAAHFRFIPRAFTLPWGHFEIWDTGTFLQFPFLSHGIPGFAVSAFWAALAGLGILVIRWIYFLVRNKEGMGLGDTKLLAMIAAWLGPQFTLLTLFLAVVGAALLGMAWTLVSRRRQKALEMRLPFGAFLCGAAIYSIFAGWPLIHWYMKFYR
jgi:leader peptidase (prepilin peptidase)/N-methyltransferase